MGYYVNNEYADQQLRDAPPEKPLIGQCAPACWPPAVLVLGRDSGSVPHMVAASFNTLLKACSGTPFFAHLLFPCPRFACPCFLMHNLMHVPPIAKSRVW